MAATLPATRSPQMTTESTPADSAYNAPIGYLRAFITLLVLGHHAALAYHPYAPPPPTSLVAVPRWWQAFPVVDQKHWDGWALFVGFNDIFFMSLMFFLSGLFVWKSLQKKGAGSFLRDRMVRLGVPFVLAAGVIAPLAYYPTYLQTRAGGGFWRQWMSLGNWPAGPAWFVWVLLAFDVVAATLLLLSPQWGEGLGRLTSGASRRPFVFFLGMVAISTFAYLPMELVFGSFRWSAFGPFTFQTSRAVHYLMYFLMGCAVGASGLGRGLLAKDGNLMRRWILWSLGALMAFAVATGVGLATITAHIGSRGWEIAADCTWVLSCAASSFALLALFVRFANGRTRILDSLRDNAYGMYLVHYAAVSWLQYELLPASLSGFTKGVIAFAGTVLISWGSTAAMRQIPGVRRVI